MLIHFLNDQILNLHGLPDRYPSDRLAGAVERSLLAAVVVSDGPVIVPTVDIVQSPVTKQILDTLSVLADHGHVDFVGSSTDIDELVSRKQVHFQGTGYHLEWASTDPYEVLTPLASNFNMRQGDTTYDMLTLWSSDVDEIARNGRGRVNEGHKSFSGRQLTQAQHLMSRDIRRSAYLDAAYRLPDKLGDHAFLWSVVQRIAAFKHKTAGPEKKSFERALAYYWVMSHVQEYGRQIVARDEYLGQIDCGLRHQHAKFTFDMARFRVFLKKIGLERLVQSTVDEVCDYKEEPGVLISVSNILRPWFDKLEQPYGDKTHLVRSLQRIAPDYLRDRSYRKFMEPRTHADSRCATGSLGSF